MKPMVLSLVLLLLASSSWAQQVKPMPYVVVEPDGWKVLEIIDRTTVFVEGRMKESVSFDSRTTTITSRHGSTRIETKTPSYAVRGRERAVVVLPSREVKKMEEGDYILGEKKLAMFDRQRIKLKRGSTTEVWAYRPWTKLDERTHRKK